MIGYVEGTWRKGGIIVDKAGVGWKVTTNTAGKAGEQAALLITTVVKEDSITLYGFEREEEQATFVALGKVSGIGPIGAMNILAGLTPEKIAGAVAAKNPAVFASIKGVGTKGGEKIVIGMKIPPGVTPDKVEAVAGGAAVQSDPVEQALIKLGWDKNKAKTAVAGARANHTDEKDVLRAALTAQK